MTDENKWRCESESEVGPPDGGCRAWSVMLASFLCNGIIFSVINTYSVIYVELLKELQAHDEHGASSKAALVGSMAIGFTFLFSPIAGMLTDLVGIQTTAIIGSSMTVAGMFLSSFVTSSVEGLCFTYGIVFGSGASLIYTPSLVILGHYFQKYIGMVNGFVTAGSSVLTIVMPYTLSFLLEKTGLSNTFRLLAGLMVGLILSALLFKPLSLPPSKNKKSIWKRLFNTNIWKERRFTVWATIIPLTLFGYFIPYVHLVKFVSVTFPEEDGKILVLLIGLTSGFGRLMFGKIADNPRINRIFLQQLSFVLIGVLTMLIVVTPNFFILKLVALGMGLFDGCFISLLGPIAFDFCGKEGASQAIGFLLGLCSLPLTIGPPVAGIIYDATGSYKVPFLLAGLPPILGGLALSYVHFIKKEKEISLPPPLLSNGQGADAQTQTDPETVHLEPFA